MAALAQIRLNRSDFVALTTVSLLLALLVLRQGPSWTALWVTLAFAVAGWALRGVDLGGGMAGFAVAYVVFAVGGWKLFAVLALVFALTLLATLAGRGKKRALGLAEPMGGRSAAQVAANLVVATAALVLLPAGLGIVVALAALAEATADTVSSEIGEAFGSKTYLVTTLRPTPPGTNGGVSLVGTLAGIAAASAVAGVGLISISATDAMLVAVASVFGMIVDSVLGATLENRGYLNNDVVNVMGTASAAVIAYVFCV